MNRQGLAAVFGAQAPQQQEKGPEENVILALPREGSGVDRGFRVEPTPNSRRMGEENIGSEAQNGKGPFWGENHVRGSEPQPRRRTETMQGDMGTEEFALALAS